MAGGVSQWSVPSSVPGFGPVVGTSRDSQSFLPAVGQSSRRFERSIAGLLGQTACGESQVLKVFLRYGRSEIRIIWQHEVRNAWHEGLYATRPIHPYA